jgi:hypothetical protein
MHFRVKTGFCSTDTFHDRHNEKSSFVVRKMNFTQWKNVSNTFLRHAQIEEIDILTTIST